MLFASANCAEIVTAVPSSAVEALDVTRYFAAGPTIVSTFPLVPVRALPSVAVKVYVMPAVVFVVNETVATPLPFVVDVAVANDPPAPVLLHVTVTPDVVTGLPAASASCAETVTG